MAYALISGASSGIGSELAKLFAADYDLILVARRKDKLEQLAQELNCKTICIAKDLSDLNQVRELIQEIQDLDIQVLVNNAGFGDYGDFTKLDIEKQIEMINLNISALTYLSHAFAKRGRGKILNIASVAAFAPGPLMATYYASKAYVLSFSFALAEELRRQGIQVSVACPGPTHTEFGKRARVGRSVPFKFAMNSLKVAQIIFAEFMRGKTLIVTGFRNHFLIALIRVLPREVLSRVNYLLMTKLN